MANQLLDVAPNDIITSNRQNTINDMIDDGSTEINTLFLEIGGTTAIDASRSIVGNTLALTQTTTTGVGLGISRDLDSASTDSAVAAISNLNTSDNQPALSISQAASSNSLSIIHSDSNGPVVNISNSGAAPIDVQADNWSLRYNGLAYLGGIYIGGNELVDGSRNIDSGGITATSLGVGSTSIASSGVISGYSLSISAFDVDTSGNLNMGIGSATIDISGNADFQSLSINGNVIYQPDGFFVPPVPIDPVSPVEGQMWLNTTDIPQAVKIFLGGAVKILVTG